MWLCVVMALMQAVTHWCMVLTGDEDVVGEPGGSRPWAAGAVYQPGRQQAHGADHLWGKRAQDAHEAMLQVPRPTAHEDGEKHLPARRTHQDPVCGKSHQVPVCGKSHQDPVCGKSHQDCLW